MTEKDYSFEGKVYGLVDQLNAYIEQYHGGSVQIDKIEGNTVHVTLGGACEGCPRAHETLQGWVAGTLRQFFPDVEVVEAD